MEAHSYYQETGEILQYHHVPRLTRYNKQALAYEIEFLKIATTLWRMLPYSVKSIFPVRMNGSHMYMLIDFDPFAAEIQMPDDIKELDYTQFIRPSKKVRGGKQNMKTN